MEIQLSFTEENYLKSIYHLSAGGVNSVSTNALSESMNTKPATVSDMLRKLAAKKIISYEKYKGVMLNPGGAQMALRIIRKHRLWEVFLVDILKFNWDEVHQIAEQLEHIQSQALVEKLDEFLGFPKVDPHGDPIPDRDGKFHVGPSSAIGQFVRGEKCVLMKVNSDDPLLLQYLDSKQLRPGTKLFIEEKIEFDGSMKIVNERGESIFISPKIAEQLWATKIG